MPFINGPGSLCLPLFSSYCYKCHVTLNVEERGRRRSLPSTPTGNQERSLIAPSRVLQRSQSCSYSTTAPGKLPKMDSIEEAEVSSSLITPGKPPKVNSIEEAEVSSSLITPGKPPKVNSIEEAVKLLSLTRSENSAFQLLLLGFTISPCIL